MHSNCLFSTEAKNSKKGNGNIFEPKAFRVRVEFRFLYCKMSRDCLSHTIGPSNFPSFFFFCSPSNVFSCCWAFFYHITSSFFCLCSWGKFIFVMFLFSTESIFILHFFFTFFIVTFSLVEQMFRERFSDYDINRN